MTLLSLAPFIAAGLGALIASIYFVRIVRSLFMSLRELKAQQRRLDVERDFYDADAERAKQALEQRRESIGRLEKLIADGQARLKQAEAVPPPCMYLIKDVPGSDNDWLFAVRITAKPDARLRPEDGFVDNIKHAVTFAADPSDAAQRVADAHQPFTDFIITSGRLLS